MSARMAYFPTAVGSRPTAHARNRAFESMSRHSIPVPDAVIMSGRSDRWGPRRRNNEILADLHPPPSQECRSMSSPAITNPAGDDAGRASRSARHRRRFLISSNTSSMTPRLPAGDAGFHRAGGRRTANSCGRPALHSSNPRRFAAAAEEKKPTLVVLHHPPITCGHRQ